MRTWSEHGTLIFFFFPDRLACWILVPWPEIKPVLPALAAWSLNHWTTREVQTRHSGQCLHTPTKCRWAVENSVGIWKFLGWEWGNHIGQLSIQRPAAHLSWEPSKTKSLDEPTDWDKEQSIKPVLADCCGFWPGEPTDVHQQPLLVKVQMWD